MRACGSRRFRAINSESSSVRVSRTIETIGATGPVWTIDIVRRVETPVLTIRVSHSVRIIGICILRTIAFHSRRSMYGLLLEGVDLVLKKHG